MIETERTCDSKLLHYYFARAVGETPVLVRKLVKDLPTAAYVIFGKKVDLSKSAAKELFAQTNGTRGLTARLSNVSVSSMI